MIHALVGLLAAAVMAVPTGTDVDYQLGGARRTPAANVGIVVRDRNEPPAAGRFNICYVNGFQTQPNEKAFWARRPGLILRDGTGEPVVDEAWGEFLLDVRTADQAQADRQDRQPLDRGMRGRRLRRRGVRQPRLLHPQRRAAEAPARDSGTRALLVDRARTAHGLAAGQKNLAGFDGHQVGYDFAVSEECGRYDECGAYVDDFGDQVLMIEYRADDFEETCAAYGATHAVVLRDRDLSPEGVHEWC